MPEIADSRLHDVVSALAYSLAAAANGRNDPRLAPPYNDITQFVLRESARMSGLLRLPLAALTETFDAAGLLRRGKRFRHQSEAERRGQIGAWRESSRGLQRDFIRFYESLVMLALHSRLTESRPPEAAGVEDNRRQPAPSEIHCEIAVIGSGPGGSITACLLAEAGREVLLLEEGPFLPLESCVPFSLREMEQKYRNGGLTVAMGRTKIAYVEGRCVGGGSEINSGLYHRTPPQILDDWRRDFDVQGLTEADLRPHFEACERELSVSLSPGAAPAAGLKLHDGAVRLGWKSQEVPRWFRYENSDGPSPSPGSRQSMTRTYIPRFLAAGGKLLARTRVESMAQEGPAWRLQARRAGDGDVRIRAGAVFACAGAVQTPALLLRSGIKRNVGRSLRVHPTVKIVSRFAEPINAADVCVPVRQVKEFAPRISLGCSISTPPYLALGLLDHRREAGQVSADWPRLASYYAMITGEGWGRVDVVPGVRDPWVRYRLTNADHGELANGLKLLGEALFAGGAAELYPGLPGGSAIKSADQLAELSHSFPVGGAGVMTIHLFSSCPMGERASKCAADSFGRVHGVPNLYIADASLLCGAPGVNPQGTIMALARRNALHFLGRT